MEPLTIGSKFDRYGGRYVAEKFIDNGTFAAPTQVPFEQRALPSVYKTTKPLNAYEVIKEIPNVKKGNSIPWFGQPGCGMQFQFPDGFGIDYLLKNNYIKPI